MKLLPPGGKATYFFAMGPNCFKGGGALPPFEVALNYENMSGHAVVREFKIDIQQFESMGTLGSDPLYEISKSLRQIEKSLAGVARNLFQ